MAVHHDAMRGRLLARARPVLLESVMQSIFARMRRFVEMEAQETSAPDPSERDWELELAMALERAAGMLIGGGHIPILGAGRGALRDFDHLLAEWRAR